MIKFIITGGDNGYCGYSNSIADRELMVVNTAKKTLQYVSFPSICLCQKCFYPKCSNSGKYAGFYLFRYRKSARGGTYTYTFESTSGKLCDLHDPEHNTIYPVEVKGNKWGKDGEYGSYGMVYGATYETDADSIDLVRFKKDKETEYWADSDNRKPNDYYFEPTGWKLLRGVA